MPSVADKDMDDLMARLSLWLKHSDMSLRTIAEKTKHLDPPEAMHHPNISMALRRNKKFFMQQVLVLLHILNIPPVAFFCGTDDLGDAKEIAGIVQSLMKLPRARRRHLLEAIKSEAKTSSDAATPRKSAHARIVV